MIAANLEDDDLENLEEEEEQEEVPQVRPSAGAPGAQVSAWWRRSCCFDWVPVSSRRWTPQQT